uniref:Probable splicing factor YJU2B n=1 Tax=Ornithorhynchus anatinus TaxID=9258 RepID=F6YF99_ORNAN
QGERKGVNKYYPPDFDPAKHGSLNRYQNSHPLRERARKLSQGILIIRFEMPYNIWCDGCKNHIGMGVRYNAEKKKVGNYYTTPIYRFRMKCHLCVNYIEMQTDPANCDYVIVSGAQRKEERWDMEDNEQILTTEGEEKKKLETDAMFRLEHGTADRGKLQKAIPTLSNIQEAQSAWKDDFALNSMLRRKFREEKKVIKEEEEKDLALQTKANLSIPLVRESEEDRKLASLFKYHSLDSYEAKRKLKRTEISGRPWFSPTSTPGSGGKASGVLKKLAMGRKPSTSNPSPRVSNLGIVLRKPKEECEDPAGGLVSGGVPETLGAGEGEEGSWEVVRDGSGGPSDPEGPQETESERAPCAASLGSSLVADYSDTESD